MKLKREIRNKFRLRWTALALCFIILLLAASGCKSNSNSKKESVSDEVSGIGSVTVTEDGRRVLTGIFASELIHLPEGMELSSAVRPDFDPESGILRVFATCQTNEMVSDGENEFEFPVDHFTVVTLYPDGTCEEVPVPLHWSGFVACGVFEKDGLRYIEADQSTKQMRLTLKRIRPDGAVEDLGANMDALFSRDFPFKMFLFPNGDTLYLKQKEAILVGEDGLLKARDTAGSDIQDAGMTAEGRVFATWNAGKGAVLAELDPESGGFLPLIELGNSVVNVRFGSGYDFYYTDDGGVCGATFDGETWTSAPLLSYLNSGLNRAVESIVAPLSPEVMVFRNSRNETILYRKSPDLDLADVKILSVGCDSTYTISSAFSSAVSAFQKSHPDVRIVTEDYVGYNTKEKPDGGTQQLSMELVTGLFKPDLLIGPADADYMTQVREKGLYRDLSSVFSGDDELFGCIRNLYDDGRDGLWGITAAFSVQRTVFADPARLGKYAGQGFLSPVDFIDLAESLGEGCVLLPTFPRGITSFSWLLGSFGNGYRAFIDREAGTASFDSPEFLRVLEYLAALPTEEEERRTSPFVDMSPEDRIVASRDGTILFTENRGMWMWVQPELWTGTEDWMMIGYPTGVPRSGAGSTVTPGMTYLITSWCEEPELAEEFVSDVIHTEEGGGHFPVLKSAFRKKAQEMTGEIYALFYSGGAGVWDKDDWHPASDAELSEPGFLTEFTPEKAARLEKMLDETGTPLRLNDDEEILFIVRDEVMSFLSGVGTAEDCAAKIQSRVSIWLAEHK